MMVGYVNIADDLEEYSYDLWHGLPTEADAPFSKWAGFSLLDHGQDYEDYSDIEMGDMVNSTLGNELAPTTYGSSMMDAQEAPTFSEQDL